MKIARIILLILIFLSLITLFTLLIRNGNMQLLNPQGYIADIQSKILFGALILAALIGIPFVATTFFVAMYYREGNTKATYKPFWTGNKKLIFLWWLLPTLLILCIAVVIWQTAHLVDPYQPLPYKTKPILIQVIALQWKWLFLYPEQHIATVNFLEFPQNTPIDFQLTADAPMNSFWIPQLGGQIYAMSGMTTQLHFVANKIGNFPGGGAEMSGAGYAGMQFIAHSVTQQNFNAWLEQVKKNKTNLDSSLYTTLAKPSINIAPTWYTYNDTSLYNAIIEKFMTPNTQ